MALAAVGPRLNQLLIFLSPQASQTNQPVRKKTTHKHRAADDIKNELRVVFVPVVFNWARLLQIHTLSLGRDESLRCWRV